jgi:hypothetical protein
MSDDRSRFGRFPQRDDIRPCAPHESRPLDGCPVCASQMLRPYRVVRRYRGDRVAQDVEAGSWCRLWGLQTGDVSWPRSRKS